MNGDGLVSLNDGIFTMMHHVAGDLNAPHTLYLPTILQTFSRYTIQYLPLYAFSLILPASLVMKWDYTEAFLGVKTCTFTFTFLTLKAGLCLLEELHAPKKYGERSTLCYFRILEDSTELCDDWVDLVEYIIQKFIQVLLSCLCVDKLINLVIPKKTISKNRARWAVQKDLHS